MNRPRRSHTTNAAKAVKKEEVSSESSNSDADDDDFEGEEEEEEEDVAPPILEREPSCGENDETNGSTAAATTTTVKKEEPEEATTTSPDVVVVLEEDEDEDVKKQKNQTLLEALSSVFAADSTDDVTAAPKVETRGRPPKNAQTQSKAPAKVEKPAPMPKHLLLQKARGIVPPVLNPQTASSSRFQVLPRKSLNSTAATPRTQNFGPPPPIPRSIRSLLNTHDKTKEPSAAITTGVGSNTSVGPARLLEGRKRAAPLDEPKVMVKRASLVAYNGGRAGETFRKSTTSASTSASPSTSSSANGFDVQSMLREHSPVRIQVSAGNGAVDDDVGDLTVLRKEAVAKVARESSNHTMLLGSMIINGLNRLQERPNDDYHKFSGELFALITKYRLH